MSYKADTVANDNVKIQLFRGAAVVTGTYHANAAHNKDPTRAPAPAPPPSVPMMSTPPC